MLGLDAGKFDTGHSALENGMAHQHMRMWRNWQTRMVQVHVLAREWRFKSSHPHQATCEGLYANNGGADQYPSRSST